MRIAKIFLVLLFIFSLGFLKQVNSAQAQKEENKAYVLDEVVVTSSRVERLLKELPSSISVVDEKEIRRKPAANVADQISNIPGVIIYTENAGNKKINIRGMSGDKVLILINGIRQPELRSSYGADIKIDPNQIERIEVIKGPASVLYGSDAIGGVVNIITKKGQGKPFSYSQKITFDSANNSLKPQASFFGDYKGLNYRFSGSAFNAGNVQVPSGITKGRLENTAFKQRDYSGQLGYDWDGGQISFMVDYSESRDVGHILRYTDADGELLPAAPEKARAYAGMNPEISRLTYSMDLSLDDLSEELVKFQIKAYGQNMTRESINYGYKTNASYTKGLIYNWEDNLHDSWGGSVQSDWQLGAKHYLILGLDYEKIDFESTAHNYHKKTGAYTGSNYKKANQDHWGLFLQDEWSITDTLKSTVGLRQTWVNTEATKDTGSSHFRAGKSNDNKLVGSVGLVYSGFDSLELRALFSQGYKSPSVIHLFMGTSSVQGNSNLKPESSDNYEIGARFSQGNWNIDGALFYGRLKDVIYREPTVSGTPQYQYQNLDKVTTYGTELVVDYTFAESNLTPYVSATWLRYISEDSNGFEARHVRGQPMLWGSGGLKWEAPFLDEYNFYSDLNMVLSRKSYQAEPDGSRKNEKSGWGTLNLAFGVEGGDDIKYQANVNLKNILNQEYFLPNSTLYIEPGFNAVLSFGITF